MTSHKRRSLTMKQAREKIRPRNKGKKKAKVGEKNNQNLPLLNKLIYIDIKQGKQCELIEEQLKKLGARVEKFLSCEINYVISLTGPLKTEKINAKDDNPQSPSFVNMTSPFNCGPSPTGNNEIKKAVVSRGKALAQIACSKNQASSVVANAEKLGIKIISLDAASKWLEKELKKLDRECQNDASKNEDKTSPFNSQTHASKKKKKLLKGPFIKFEAVNKLYKPIKSEFPTWPKINLMAPPGICPFGEARLKVQHQYKTRKYLPEPSLPPCSEPVSGNRIDTAEHKEQEIRKPKNVKATVGAFPELVGVPIVTAGEVKGNFAVHYRKTAQINKQQGYCDCCEIKYKDLDEHLTSYEHRAFVRDKSNFESLDALINKVPSTVQFLQSVLLKHCVQKLDVDGSSENSVGNFLSLVSPISPLTTERVPSLETVPTSLFVPQELKDENLPSKNKLTTDGTEYDTKTKTPNDDHLSAVVIRRPTPSGIFTSPRRRQPTPSKKPWVQERSMVFRDSPMASLQPSIKSSPSITLAESVCLSGTRCFSAPSLNKKQEFRKSTSRSLVRVIDFTQMANLGNDKTEQTIELPGAQHKALSAGEVKQKLIASNVCFKQNKKKLYKLRHKENKSFRQQKFHEDIIQDFHYLTLSTDEKVTFEVEGGANRNRFSSEHFKDTSEREAKATSISPSLEQFKITTERKAYSSEHLENTIVREAANINSFSSEYLKNPILREAIANNSFSSKNFKSTITSEAIVDQNSFSSEHLENTIVREANVNSSLSSKHKSTIVTTAFVNDNSFSSDHFESTIVKEVNTKFSLSSEHFKKSDEMKEANANKSFSSELLKESPEKKASANKSFSSEHFKDTTERQANASYNSFPSKLIKSTTNSSASEKVKFSSQTQDESRENKDNFFVKKQNSVYESNCELNDVDLLEEKLSNDMTLSKKNKSKHCQLTLSDKKNSLQGFADIYTKRISKKRVGSKSLAETLSLIRCETNLESEGEITLHSPNKTYDFLSQNGKDCEVHAPEGDCLKSTPQKKTSFCNKKAKVTCSLEQVCNISAMKFNCVGYLGPQLIKNVFDETFQNDTNLNLPSTNKEIQKERLSQFQGKECRPFKNFIHENCVEKLPEEEMSCDFVGQQDDCELDTLSISVPNIADRVKTRQRVGQLMEQFEDEADQSTLTAQEEKKRRERKQRSLKTTENLPNDNSAYSDSKNILKTSEQASDLALPAIPNIAERVKKRRSCTLFNHEGQYSNSGLNNSRFILSPEMLQLHTSYIQRDNQKMMSTSSEKNSFRRKLIFSGSKSTVNVDEESKLSSDCTESSPAVVIRRRNPSNCRVRTNKDWSKHETDKEHSDNQTSSNSNKMNDCLRGECDKKANLTLRSENVSAKCFKKKTVNVSNESTNKRDQNVASENSLKMNTISNSPRLVLKIKRQTKNTFSSTLEEIDCSSSLNSQINQAGSSQKPETPQHSNRAKCLDSDSESIKFVNCSPTPRKQVIYSSPNCNIPPLITLHEKSRRLKKRKRLHFEEICETSIKSLERSNSPIFSSPAVKNSSITKSEIQKYSTRMDSPIFSKKQSINTFNNEIDEPNVNLKAGSEVKTVKVDLKDDDNNSECAEFEDFSSDATYIYDAEGFEVHQVENFHGQIVVKSSHEIAGYNDYKDFLTFIPKQNSPEKTVSSWGDICESYIDNAIVMTVASNGVRTSKDTLPMSPCTIKKVRKSVKSTSGKRRKRRLSEVNCFGKMGESCKKKLKV